MDVAPVAKVFPMLHARVFLALLFILATGASWGAPRPDIELGTFEGQGFSGWESTGAAFGDGPYRPGPSSRFKGRVGDGVAWSARTGEEPQGQLVSREFVIQRPYLSFLTAGFRDLPGRLGVELLVDGRTVRAASATERFSMEMYWRTWDVRELAGRRARLRVNDRSPSGSIAVDQFILTDAERSPPVDSRVLFQESLRPQFHYTPASGWMNDANGLFYNRGQWHLFHQHRPPGSPAVVWAHAVSSDLVHWRHRPTAIREQGDDAAFSGSGLVDEANASGLQRGNGPPVLLCYTLHPPGSSGRKATQCLAYSDDGGESFRAYPGNPILRTPDNNDRDPKLFYYGPAQAWLLLLSLSRNNVDREHAAYGLFRSPDLRAWKLLQEIGPGPWYWECPDMFELPIDGDPRRTKWLLLKGSGDYIVGTFDGKRFTSETEPIRINWHNGYYGAQTFSNAPDGRRVQIGWMNVPKSEAPNAWPGMPFNQQMSFPRELRLRSTAAGPRLFREPAAEIAALRKSVRQFNPRALGPGENALAGVAPGLLEIECEIRLEQARRVSLRCRSAELSYEVKSHKLRLLRADPTLELADGRLKLHVLLDRTSVEAFVGGGETDVCGAYFPDPADQRLTLTVEGGPAFVERLVVRELRSIWTLPPPSADGS